MGKHCSPKRTQIAYYKQPFFKHGNIFILMTAYTFSDVLLLPKEQASTSDLLHASVEFGVLQSSGNCVNIGICRVNPTHHINKSGKRQKNRRCPLADALLSLTPEGRLQAFFPKSGMKPCTERVFFRGPVFPVPIAHLLSEAVQRCLPGLTHPTIEAGLYTIKRIDEGFLIRF